MNFKVNDKVMVIAGKGRKEKQTGIVKKILPNNKVIVEGIGLVKKHQKSRGNFDGEIIEMERAIDASNLSLYSEKTKEPSRVRYEVTEKKGKKVKERILVKTNEKVSSED